MHAPTEPQARRDQPSAKALERISTEGHRFDFFQIVWLLQRFMDDKSPVGREGPIAKEPLRFRPHLSMGFPATDVRRVTPIQDEDGNIDRFKLDATFLGLYGVTTPLPLNYAIRVLRTVQQQNRSAGSEAGPERAADANESDAYFQSSPLRDLLDLVHHRLLSFFFRAWLKYRHYAAYCLPEADPISEHLSWMIGCPPHFDDAALGVPRLQLIRYAGMLTQHPRSASSLEGMLKDFWPGLPFQTRQAVGRWVALPQANMHRMGKANASMGIDINVGEQVFDLSGAFDIILGPVDWVTYQAFLPDAGEFKRIRALTRLFCVDRLGFSVEIQLLPDQVPEMTLGGTSPGSRLGYTSWVRTGPMGPVSVRFEAER